MWLSNTKRILKLLRLVTFKDLWEKKTPFLQKGQKIIYFIAFIKLYILNVKINEETKKNEGLEKKAIEEGKVQMDTCAV